MPKKKCVNAFSLFLTDLRDRRIQKGQHCTLKDVADEASRKWQMLTVDEKQVYADRAREIKGEKLTSTGERVADIVQQEERKQQFNERMRRSIIKYVHVEENPYAGPEEIASQIYYIVHINYYCHDAVLNRYVPAEIAVSRFSVKDGVTSSDIYHTIVNPGSLPLGYTYTAQAFSKETHQLPNPPHEYGESNMHKIFNNIVRFLKQNLANPNGKLPPVYADDNNMEIAKQVLDEMSLTNGFTENYIRVYSLSFLMFTLGNAVNERFHTESLAAREIERDVCDFVMGICCDFHKTKDVYQFCSKSRVTRYAYVTGMACAKALGVTVNYSDQIEEADEFESRPSSTMTGSTVRPGSSFSSRSYSTAASMSNTDYCEEVERPESSMSSMSAMSNIDPRSAPRPNRRPNTRSEAMSNYLGPSLGRGRGRFQ